MHEWSYKVAMIVFPWPCRTHQNWCTKFDVNPNRKRAYQVLQREEWPFNTLQSNAVYILIRIPLFVIRNHLQDLTLSLIYSFFWKEKSTWMQGWNRQWNKYTKHWDMTHSLTFPQYLVAAQNSFACLELKGGQAQGQFPWGCSGLPHIK